MNSCEAELVRRREQRQKLRDGVIRRSTHVRTNTHSWRPRLPALSPTSVDPPRFRRTLVCKFLGHRWPTIGRRKGSVCMRCGTFRAR